MVQKLPRGGGAKQPGVAVEVMAEGGCPPTACVPRTVKEARSSPLLSSSSRWLSDLGGSGVRPRHARATPAPRPRHACHCDLESQGNRGACDTQGGLAAAGAPAPRPRHARATPAPLA
eukprot:gene12829-biopygen8527